ncbi:hypothetical protein QYF36_022383 [Acer negundo]|nr:hypothetical protein QYF36_022383 [Acer negundo]
MVRGIIPQRIWAFSLRSGGDSATGGSRVASHPQRSRHHTSIGTKFANSPSSLIHVSDKGQGVSQKVFFGEGDLDIDLVNQGEVSGVVMGGGGGGADQRKPFACILPSVCTIDMLSRLRCSGTSSP